MAHPHNCDALALHRTASPPDRQPPLHLTPALQSPEASPRPSMHPAPVRTSAPAAAFRHRHPSVIHFRSPHQVFVCAVTTRPAVSCSAASSGGLAPSFLLRWLRSQSRSCAEKIGSLLLPIPPHIHENL